MSIELKLLDHLKLTNHLSRNFACAYSEDDRFFILTDIGIYILALKPNLSSSYQELCCTKNFITLSDFNPSKNIDLDINEFHKELDRKDLYETVLPNEYSSALSEAKQIEIQPISAEWSPKLIESGHCLLATLSSFYNLEIYTKYLDQNETVQYKLISNLTTRIIEIEKDNWECCDDSINTKLLEFKRRIFSVTPTAFTWSHNFDSCSVIFVALSNGDVILFKLQQSSIENVQISNSGRCSTKLKRITTLHWHRTSLYGGVLCVGDETGRVKVLHVLNLNSDKAAFEREETVCSDSNNVKVDAISVIEFDTFTCILIAKQNIVIVYGINSEGDVFDQKFLYVEHLYITGFKSIGNNILILTLPGIFINVQIYVKNNEICFKEKKIQLKLDVFHYRTHGFFCTKNSVLFGILTYPWEMQQFTSSKNYVNLLIYHNNCINPFTLLWNNPTGSLENYWDCLEALRIVCLKEKRFPWLGLPPDLNYDKLNLLQLKTLRCVAQISENVFEVVPILKDYNIKPLIILNYLVNIKLAVGRIKKLLIEMQSGKELTVFQMRSIDIQNFFLKEMVLGDVLVKSNVGECFIKEIYDVMEVANELEYPDMAQCIWCGEKLLGTTCLPPHADMRCAFSMMPIFLIPAYKCPICNAITHKEIELELPKIVCPYCDVFMEKISVDPESYIKQALSYHMDVDGEIKSNCFDDCLKEEINFEDIEENSNEYVIFSDSDGDEVDSLQLDKLYFRMEHFSLDELVRLTENRDDGDESDCGPAKISRTD